MIETIITDEWEPTASQLYAYAVFQVLIYCRMKVYVASASIIVFMKCFLVAIMVAALPQLFLYKGGAYVSLDTM